MFPFSLHQLVIVLPQDGLKDFLHHLTIKTVVLYIYSMKALLRGSDVRGDEFDFLE